MALDIFRLSLQIHSPPFSTLHGGLLQLAPGAPGLQQVSRWEAPAGDGRREQVGSLLPSPNAGLQPGGSYSPTSKTLSAPGWLSPSDPSCLLSVTSPFLAPSGRGKMLLHLLISLSPALTWVKEPSINSGHTTLPSAWTLTNARPA